MRIVKRTTNNAADNKTEKTMTNPTNNAITYSAFGRHFSTIDEAESYGADLINSGEVTSTSFILFQHLGNVQGSLWRVVV